MIMRARWLLLLWMSLACTFHSASAFTSSASLPLSLPSLSTSTSTSSQLHQYESSTNADQDRSYHNLGYELPINIEETAPRDIPTFETWAYNYGIQRHESFTLVDNNNDGYDIYASTSSTDAVPTGTCVLYVPQELILSGSKSMDELRSHDMDPAEKIVFSVNAEKELAKYYLIVKLLVEIEKGEDSPWFPWLNS